MPIRGESCEIYSEKKDAHLNGEFEKTMPDPENSSVLLTPKSSPSKDSSSSSLASSTTTAVARKREKSVNDCLQNMNDSSSHPHKQLLLVMQSTEKPSAKKKGRYKKHRVVSAHRKSLSPTQKPRSSNNRQRKNTTNSNNTSHSQGQTTVTDYFPVRRSSRQTKTCLEIKKYQDMESAVLDKREEGLKVVDFNGKGRGVVTTRPFSRGEFVVEYAGDLITHKTAKDRERVYAANPNFGCYMYYFNFSGKNYCVDATDESGRLGRLINHSRTGNCHTKLIGIKGRPYLILVASRDIEDGEELLYDYGDRRKSSLAAHPWLRE